MMGYFIGGRLKRPFIMNRQIYLLADADFAG